MKLTTRSRYGTLIVLDVAQHGGSGPVRIADIARRKNISLKYTEKITGELRRAGILTSRRGPKGGHMLARDAAKLRVGDVVRVLDWEEPDEECPSDPGECARLGECMSRRLWRDAARALMAQLDTVSFADLVADRAGCPATSGRT